MLDIDDGNSTYVQEPHRTIIYDKVRVIVLRDAYFAANITRILVFLILYVVYYTY